MLDLTNTPDGFLGPVARVVEAALDATDDLSSDDVMLVGAWCRDILHRALGHTFTTTATRDLDLALALSSWDSYRALATVFPRVGDTGIRFRIADVDVDLLPFGDIEDPQGSVEPPLRGETLSVWAFEEIFTASLPLALPPTTIRIPTVAGFEAAKFGAWLDRSAWLEAKDASDIALILHWYAESADVQNRLYETPAGNEFLISADADVPLAAAQLLGIDVAATIGPARLAELLARWPGDGDLLVRELELRGGPAWPSEAERRREVLGALTDGLQAKSSVTRAQTLAGAMGLASWRARWTLGGYAAAATGGAHCPAGADAHLNRSLNPLGLNEVGVTDAVLATLRQFGPGGAAYAVSARAENHYFGADIAFVDVTSKRTLLYQAKLARIDGSDLKLKSTSRQPREAPDTGRSPNRRRSVHRHRTPGALPNGSHPIPEPLRRIGRLPSPLRVAGVLCMAILGPAWSANRPKRRPGVRRGHAAQRKLLAKWRARCSNQPRRRSDRLRSDDSDLALGVRHLPLASADTGSPRSDSPRFRRRRHTRTRHHLPRVHRYTLA